jgi:hypothetical protein
MAEAARRKISSDHDIEVAWPRVLEAFRAVTGARERERHGTASA